MSDNTMNRLASTHATRFGLLAAITALMTAGCVDGSVDLPAATQGAAASDSATSDDTPLSGGSADTSGSMSTDEFRQVWSEFLTGMEQLNRANGQGDRALGRITAARAKFAALTDNEVRYVMNGFADPRAFAAHVAELLAATATLTPPQPAPSAPLSGAPPATLAAPFANATAPALFSPAYPTGGNYDVFTATLDGFGLLADSDDAGSALNDERCSSDGEAAQQIALAVEKVICEAGYAAADALPADALTVAARAAAFVAVIVCIETTVATEITIAQCSLQDALVDSAEIEATYENSKIISGQVNDVHTALEVHDADIKSQLDDIEAVVNANGAKLDTLLERQLEVVRLLHTPQGQRQTNVPGCNGGPCDWPN